MRFAVFIRERLGRFVPLAKIVLPILAIAVAATQLAHLPVAKSAVAMVRAAAGEWWAVPLFAAIYIFFAVFLLPVGLLSAAAALAWGWKLGGTIELVTATVAAIGPFILARRGLKRVKAAENVPELDSPFLLFLLRIVPLVPYVALNYIAGATRIRPRDYVVTTFAGSIPSVFLFAWFVDTMTAGATGAATQAKIVAACLLVAAAAVILRWAARRLARPSSASR